MRRGLCICMLSLLASSAFAADAQFSGSLSFFQPLTRSQDVSAMVSWFSTPRTDFTMYLAYTGYQVKGDGWYFNPQIGMASGWKEGQDTFITELGGGGAHKPWEWFASGDILWVPSNPDYYGWYRIDRHLGKFKLGAHVEQVNQFLQVGPHASFGGLMQFRILGLIGHGNEAIRVALIYG